MRRRAADICFVVLSRGMWNSRLASLPLQVAVKREIMKDRPLRLLVLAHANRAAGGRLVGINLLDALLHVDEPVEVQPILPTGCGYERIADAASLDAVWFRQNGSLARRLWFDFVSLPRQARAIEPDAIIALGNVGLLNPPVPQAVLIHDAHYVYPRRHYGRMSIIQHMRYFVQTQQLKHGIARSAIIYCQTPTMLRHLRERFGNSQGMKLMPNAIPAFSVGDNSVTSVPQRLRSYADRLRLICLSRYYPHKNLEGILDMFQTYRQDLRGVVVFLTMTSAQHSGARRLLARIDRLGLSDHIVNVGPIEQCEIPACFRACDALLFPTLMESFSATYLEAMSLGLPILTSDLDFARDVCGPAALYFDPWSATSMKQAVLKISRDRSLREHLARSGRQRLKAVHGQSWENIVGTMVSDLRELVFGRRDSCVETEGS